jgi:hypothetical protein
MGKTPLHLLCRNPRTPVDVVQTSLEEYPDALPEIADVARTDRNLLPL